MGVDGFPGRRPARGRLRPRRRESFVWTAGVTLEF